MEQAMEEKITVAKIPHDSFSLFCLKCSTSIDYDWNYCPKCGIKMNVGMQ